MLGSHNQEYIVTLILYVQEAFSAILLALSYAVSGTFCHLEDSPLLQPRAKMAEMLNITEELQTYVNGPQLLA